MGIHHQKKEPVTDELNALIEKVRSENKALQKLVDNLKTQNINFTKPNS